MMKSTGIVRKLDPLGRVVLPVELRQTLDIKTDDPFEIFTEGNKIILRKYTPGCIFCGETHNVRLVNEKNVCPKCLNTIKTST